jgi:predicted acylesterase/phospholipase RssA
MSSPFKSIAISLSGGGYRATAFHLGALSYLNHVDYQGTTLLQNVKLISTISGGTFTGVSYVLTLAQGNDFKTCFDKLYYLLQEDDLVEEALKKVNHSSKWNAQDKNKNLINAFSEIYQAKFCDNNHFALLLKANNLGHLDEFCFNATDLYNTLPFRFQKTGKIGNGKMNIDTTAAAEIRLGDIMAASSCFPGGFEPLAFPQDFIQEKNSVLEQYWVSKNYPKDIALMDGGILDNQGIESVVLEYNAGGKKIDTYIVSDVSTRNAQPFLFPATTKPGLFGQLTYNGLRVLLAVMAALGVAGIVAFWNSYQVLLILSALVATFSSLILVALFMVFRAINRAVAQELGSEHETPAILKHLRILKKTPLSILWNLIKVRLFSLGDILENTFMSRIRKLQISSLFESEIWKNIVISNNIYSLFTDYKTVEGVPPPSTQILSTLQKAANMPTALWFTSEEKEEGMLDNLIISGQINLCFQVLQYLIKKKKTFPPKDLPALEMLEARVLADYNHFIADEKWLLKEIKAPRVL